MNGGSKHGRWSNTYMYWRHHISQHYTLSWCQQYYSIYNLQISSQKFNNHLQFTYIVNYIWAQSFIRMVYVVHVWQCNVVWACTIDIPPSTYRIAGIVHGWKLSRISRFHCNSRKFYHYQWACHYSRQRRDHGCCLPLACKAISVQQQLNSQTAT